MVDSTAGGMNIRFYVRNLNGTTYKQGGGLRRDERCGSWLEHWKRGADSLRTGCAVLGCPGVAEVGAHVQNFDFRSSRQWWIVPLCKGHNHAGNDEVMVLDSRIMLVSANLALTCDNRTWP